MKVNTITTVTTDLRYLMNLDAKYRPLVKNLINFQPTIDKYISEFSDELPFYYGEGSGKISPVILDWQRNIANVITILYPAKNDAQVETMKALLNDFIIDALWKQHKGNNDLSIEEEETFENDLRKELKQIEH